MIIPSHNYKAQIVKQFSDEYHVLVETGTYYGDMVMVQLGNFREIHSIELGDDLYAKAANRFRDESHVTIYHGDSIKVLPEILKKIEEPALFWLDAHFSGGVTALGETPCPLLWELDIILTSKYAHGILIDDARCFGLLKGFPTISEIEDRLGDIQIKNDIIWKGLQ